LLSVTNELVMPTVLSIPNLDTAAPVSRPEETRATPSPAFESELRRSTAESSGLVRTERTPIGGAAAANALRQAWQSVTGEEPSTETLSVLTAHWAHETGNGKSMMNFNFAGLKGKGPSGLSVACSTREGYGENAVRIVDSFRAYKTPEEGATDYVSLLSRRYPKAVEAARSGDAGGFVSALKDRGYFTDNVDTYKARVSQLSRQAMALGFDAMGSAEAGAAIPLTDVGERGFPETGGFRDASFVPFDSNRMDFAPGVTASVDPYAFYDAIARATMRIAGDEKEDPTRKSSSI
jgi:hypothetical protein